MGNDESREHDIKLLSLLDTQPDQAMEALVEQYSPLICHVAGKYLSDPEDVKECVNDAFTEVYLHRSEFNPEKGSLALWIGTIARNRAISRYRKQKKDLSLPEEGVESVPDDLDMAAELEQAMDVEHAISQLSETDRQIIRMKYYGGMSLSEIAKSLHIPYETVKKRHTRSIKSLRRLLLTILVIATLLILAACGVIKLLRHFSVLPGYGVTSASGGSSYVLEQPTVYQEGIVTVEITKGALFDGKLTVEFNVMLDKTGYNLPEYDEYGNCTFRNMYFSQSFCDTAGNYLKAVSRSSVPSSSTPPEGYLEEFFSGEEYSAILASSALSDINRQTRAELVRSYPSTATAWTMKRFRCLFLWCEWSRSRWTDTHTCTTRRPAVLCWTAGCPEIPWNWTSIPCPTGRRSSPHR